MFLIFKCFEPFIRFFIVTPKQDKYGCGLSYIHMVLERPWTPALSIFKRELNFGLNVLPELEVLTRFKQAHILCQAVPI